MPLFRAPSQRALGIELLLDSLKNEQGVMGKK